MKKFTFLFLSMFCMLGTLMAQDDAFTLVYSNPANGATLSKVDVMQLQFSKEVVVTLPEEEIIIKNNDTNVEYKVINGMAYGPNAIMYVQKVGDESVTYISSTDNDGNTDASAIGSYSFTIPAGCITSVDGEAFAEYSSTFTIAEPFSIVKVSPEEGTTTLSEIKITFNQEIASVRIPNSGLSMTDLYWTQFFPIKSDVVISDDKKTVTLELETPITTPGQYFLDIYNDVFTSVSGVKNEYTSLSFNIIDTTPSFSLNYEGGERVQELGDLEITFKNVNEVVIAENADEVVAYLPGGGDCVGAASYADGKITVSFDQEFTEMGEYTFMIPAGMFTMDGVANDAIELVVELFTFSITPLEVVSVTPVAGQVKILDRIVVQFNQNVRLSNDENWQQISREIKMFDKAGNEYILTYNSSSALGDKIEYLVNATWDGYQYVTTPIEAEGTYVLDIANIIVDYASEEYIDEWGWPDTRWHGQGGHCEGSYVWVIDYSQTGIDAVEAENGEQAIYDITGRRVKNMNAAGIYIVNGKKVVVK